MRQKLGIDVTKKSTHLVYIAAPPCETLIQENKRSASRACKHRVESTTDRAESRVSGAIQELLLACCSTVITHCAYVVCYFRDVYPFIYCIIAMYVHHLGLYCILFRRRFLISTSMYM